MKRILISLLMVIMNLGTNGQKLNYQDTIKALEAITDTVHVGYLIQPKPYITSSLVIANVQELTSLPFRNTGTLLQGRVTGINVVNSGAPGTSARVRIRGISSLGNNEPLYVVDGIPLYDIQALNPLDIESLVVLKDAGAAAMYGSRSSGGIVVITTKEGKQGLHVTYSMYAGQQDTGKGPTNLLNTQEYADLQWLVYKNDGISETHPIYGPSTNPSPTLPSWAANTNWYNEITDRATVLNHNLSLSGGGFNSKFLVSLNYFNQNGAIINTSSKWFTSRVNSKFTVKKILSIGENLQISHRSGNGFSNLSPDNAIGSVYRMQSIIPAIVSQPISGVSHNFIPGEWGGTGIAPRLGNARNALADLTRNKDDLNTDVRVFGNLFLEANLAKGLVLRSSFGGLYQSGYSTDYTFFTYENVINNPLSSLREGASYNSDWVWTNTIRYSRTSTNHHVDAMVGAETIQLGTGRGLYAGRAGYFSDAFSFRTISNGAITTEANSYYNSGQKVYSSFLNVNYGYMGRYLIGGSFRRDGDSSALGNKRFGSYYAVSGGWRLSEESFLANNNFISDLKIRGSYGLMGNISFASQTTSKSYQSYEQINLGLDAGLFSNKIQMLLDVYQKSGQMQNTGLDIEIIYSNQINNDFQYRASLMFATYKNEISDLGEGIDFIDSGSSGIGNLTRNQLGQSVSQFYGYQIQSLFQSVSEVINAAVQPGAEPGFFRYRDLDNNGVIDSDDRTYIGDPNPTFTFGLNLSANYKAFDLSVFLYGSYGNDIFNYMKWYTDFWPSFQGQKSTGLLYDSWTPTRTNATVPRASFKSNFSNNTVVSDYYIEDGSYTRLKNIEIGYTLPGSILKKVGVNNLRVYMQSINLFTITNYSGLDPELGGNDASFGIDYGNYPNTPIYLIGTTINF